MTNGLPLADWPAPAPLLPQEFRAADPEEFRALTPSGVQYQLVLRGRFEARRRRAASDTLIVSCGRMSLAATHRTGTGAWAFFTLVEDGPSSVMQGQALPACRLAWCRSGAEVHSQSPAGGTWWNLCFPPGRLESAGTALFGVPCPGPQGSVEVVPVSAALHRSLLAGLSAALSGRAHGSTLIDGLLLLVLDAFAPAAHGTARLPQARSGRPPRLLLVAQELAAIADEAESPLSLVEVCTELGVSLRTLNLCSNAILGMSAGAYLRRRRLHRVQAALRTGSASSVTEAATAQGFWELGRFVGDYRALFGETPSATLRRWVAGTTGRARVKVPAPSGPDGRQDAGRRTSGTGGRLP